MGVLFEKDVDDEIDFDYETLLNRVVEETIRMEQCPYECEVNILITDNQGIRLLNREYRKLDVPTDVLSFPMIEYGTPGDFSHLNTKEAKNHCFNLESGALLLGDIVISLERAREQSIEYGHSLNRELAFLTAHSMFHLMGYDHMEEGEREEMERKQEQVLQRLKITRD